MAIGKGGRTDKRGSVPKAFFPLSTQEEEQSGNLPQAIEGVESGSGQTGQEYGALVTWKCRASLKPGRDGK